MKKAVTRSITANSVTEQTVWVRRSSLIQTGKRPDGKACWATGWGVEITVEIGVKCVLGRRVSVLGTGRAQPNRRLWRSLRPQAGGLQRIFHAPCSGFERTGNRASAGVAVPTAAEALGDLRHVYGAFAAQAGAKVAVGQFAKKGSGLHAFHANQVLDDAFGVFGAGARGGHVGPGNGGPGYRATDMETAERGAEQAELAFALRKVDSVGDGSGVSAQLQQM